MAWLTDVALNKMAELDKADVKYCAGLAARFQKMGLSSKVASTAIASMIEEEAVPNGCAATPTLSLFKGHFSSEATEAVVLAS